MREKTSRTSIPNTRTTPRSSDKTQKVLRPPFTITGTDKPCAHVGRQHTTPARRGHEVACCLIQRNVTLISSCSRTGIRTVKKLVLTLAIHDKNVTMAKVARASITVRTGLALPFEERRGPKTHRDNELRAPRPPKQRLIIAVPTNSRVESPIKVQVRGSWNLPLSTPRLHKGCDSPPHTG